MNVKTVAETILRTAQTNFSDHHEYTELDPDKSLGLSRRFFQDLSDDAWRMNFERIADLGDLTLSQALSFHQPVRQRYFLSHHHTILLMGCQLSVGGSALTRTWKYLQGRAGDNVIELSTRFADGTSVTTTTMDRHLEPVAPKRHKRCYVAQHLDLKTRLELHNTAVRDHMMKHPGLVPMPINSTEQLLALLQREHSEWHEYMQANGWVTREYLRDQLPREPVLADEIYDEIQALLKRNMAAA